MTVTVYVNQVIKTKDDAKYFIDHFQGDIYVEGDGEDINLSSDKKKDGTKVFRVCTRPIKARGDIFFPYFETTDDPVDAVYKYRKYINAQLMR